MALLRSLIRYGSSTTWALGTVLRYLLMCYKVSLRGARNNLHVARNVANKHTVTVDTGDDRWAHQHGLSTEDKI
jgi:hypothetical protein